jgi:hypothetical protein
VASDSGDRFFPPAPPGTEIAGALEATAFALERFTDHPRFEQLGLLLLQEIEPSLRGTGGPGDEAQDGVGGPLHTPRRARSLGYLDRARAADVRDGDAFLAGMALEEAARRDPQAATEWLRVLADQQEYLLQAAAPALATALRVDHAVVDEWGAMTDTVARRCFAGAVHGTGEAIEQRWLQVLAGDPDPVVRDHVVNTLHYHDPVRAWHVDVALQAAKPDNVGQLARALSLHRRRQEMGHVGELTPAQRAGARQIVIASARGRRVEAYELMRVVDRLGIETLAIDWVWARVSWLAEIPVMTVEDFVSAPFPEIPDELASRIAAAATDVDRARALDLLEEHDDLEHARGAVENVLEWIDDGSELITRRLIAWYRSGDEVARYRAMRVLEHPVSWEAFTRRVRSLWTSAPGTDITEDVISARSPRFWEGSIRSYYEKLLADFTRWSSDPTLGVLGRAGADHYRRALTELRPDD